MTKKKHFFSIIIPIYNCEKYIEECINSILNQSYNNFEIIVIDDGSTDNSWDILKKISLLNNKIKIYHQENSGVSNARNKALSIAKGEYVLFIDADDYISKDALKILNDYEVKRNSLVAYGYIVKYKNYESIISCDSFSVNSENVNLENEIFCNKYIGGTLWNKIFLREVIEENNIRFDSNIDYSEDLQFILKYIKYVSKIEYINEGLYYYRMRKTSVNYKYNTKKNRTVLQLYLSLIKQYEFDYELVKRLKYVYIINYYRLKSVAEKKDIDKKIINEENIILKQNHLSIISIMKFKIIIKHQFIEKSIKKLKSLIRWYYD